MAESIGLGGLVFVKIFQLQKKLVFNKSSWSRYKFREYELEGGIKNDSNDDDEDQETIKSYPKSKLINICKRRYENGKVIYRWIKMSRDEAEKMYDEDYIPEEN